MVVSGGRRSTEPALAHLADAFRRVVGVSSLKDDIGTWLPSASHSPATEAPAEIERTLRRLKSHVPRDIVVFVACQCVDVDLKRSVPATAQRLILNGVAQVDTTVVHELKKRIRGISFQAPVLHPLSSTF